MPIQTMNKKKDWQAGLGIKSHKPLSCPIKSWHSINQLKNNKYGQRQKKYDFRLFQVDSWLKFL